MGHHLRTASTDDPVSRGGQRLVRALREFAGIPLPLLERARQELRAALAEETATG